MVGFRVSEFVFQFQQLNHTKVCPSYSDIYHETDIRYPGEISALCVVFVSYFSLLGLILLQELRGLEMLEALTM